MTEQEAKILANELMSHREWQPLSTYAILPGLWAVLLKHRVRPHWISISDARPQNVKDALAGAVDIDLSFSIDLKWRH